MVDDIQQRGLNYKTLAKEDSGKAKPIDVKQPNRGPVR